MFDSICRNSHASKTYRSTQGAVLMVPPWISISSWSLRKNTLMLSVIDDSYCATCLGANCERQTPNSDAVYRDSTADENSFLFASLCEASVLAAKTFG